MLLKNATLADGTPADLWLYEGKIRAIGQNLPANGDEVIDLNGRTVLPGFVDLHCHWRTPGFEYKEDLKSGSRSAAAGGYTYLNLMPNTKPVCSTAEQAREVQQKVKEVGLCEANQTVSITENFDGTSVQRLLDLPDDVKFITEDGKGVQNNAVMAKAFAICREKGIVLMSHAEDMEISPWDYRLAENIETIRNIHLSEYYGTRLHLCHVSTKEAILAISEAKQKGLPVTCEVTPHHLWFHDLDYKVNPPIRQQADVEALVAAIKAGYVDAIATDHAPHSAEDKAKGMAGMVGSETAFGVCYTKLCLQEGLPLQALSDLMSYYPACIMGLENKGQVKVGWDADLTVVDLEHPYTVDPDTFLSKSRNTPFAGETLYGKVCMTFKGGKVTFRAE